MTNHKDDTEVRGQYKAVVRDANGNIKETDEATNLVVDDGLAAIAGCVISDVTQSEFDHLAIGTDNTSPSAAETSLGAEDARNAATGSLVTTNATNDTGQLEASFSFSSSKTIEETGAFDSSSGGTMLSRSNGISVSVTDGDTLDLTFQLTIS